MPHALIDTQGALNSLRGPVRLRTLTTIRWLAVAGQTSAIILVHFILGFPTPLGLCLGAVAASAWLNLFTVLRFSPQRFLSDREAAAYIAFDIVQLCVLLFLTGGLQNPFAALIIAPVTIAASILPLRLTVLLAALAVAGVSILGLYHMALPWRPGESLVLARTYLAGVWVALSLSTAFFAAYAHRVAAESAQMRSALAATQLVLAREERLAALGGLAAAAAHELGTPLATIQLTASEMADEIDEDDPLHEDAALLVGQARRCRDILGRLSKNSDTGDAVHDRIDIDALLKEAAGPFHEDPAGANFIFETKGLSDNPPPVLRRRPEIIFGLRNFIENASGFARDTVAVSAQWDDKTLEIAIHDDGPGFPADVLPRLGEPYVGSRSTQGVRGARKGGMGLGFFIAKTLLEATGGAVSFYNKPFPHDPARRGACIRINWALSDVFADPIS
ncbi:MAG: ActS/PrrB/RegB family redox-sensitive histidine kinase [Pseudomonadota bacterium]